MKNDRQNILIVDDTPENLRVLTDMLTEQGYKVRPAPSGKLALSGAAAILPDLILLDIHMPEMDGYEVCRRLKADKATKSVPIIFISALSEVFDKVKAFKAGGVDYITKPFQVEEVLARISTHLTISRLHKQLEQANQDLKKRIEEEIYLNKKLQNAMDEIKVLSGLIPICSYCKKIRDDDGYWHQLEAYLDEHSQASFSHGICNECCQNLYADLDNNSE
ncbi:MAG: response regulator [Desulfobacteraceae bacterium]|nr:response regulator [Desulfobacteraceae bacterium]